MFVLGLLWHSQLPRSLSRVLYKSCNTKKA